MSSPTFHEEGGQKQPLVGEMRLPFLEAVLRGSLGEKLQG